jgi:riboflavin kinase/FMN adenylyltransferase
VFHKGEFLPAMSYVGKRPTIDGHEVRIEANILDFDEHLPDKKYAMLFIAKVRDEKKFHNLDELKEMLYNDRTAVSSLHGRYVLPQTIKDLLIGGNNAEKECGC